MTGGGSPQLAYRVEEDPWQLLSGTSFELPAGKERYSVALYCPGSMPPNRLEVVEATRALDRVVLECPGPGTPGPSASFTVELDLSAVRSAWGLSDTDFVTLFHRGGPVPTSPLGSGSTVAVGPFSAPEGEGPFLAVIIGNDGRTRVAKRFTATVADGGSATVAFSPSDQLPAHTVSTSGLPAGYSYNNNGLVLYLEEGLFGFLGAGEYRGVAGGSGRYALGSEASMSTARGYRKVSRFKVLANPAEVSLSLPQPFSTTLRTDGAPHPEVEGLSYGDGNLRYFELDYSAYPLVYRARVYRERLSGGRYRLPDLTGLFGYTPPSSGSSASLNVQAVLASENIGYSLKSGTLPPPPAGLEVGAVEVAAAYTVGSPTDLD
ncbi:MAG: hypothetical protein NZL94_10815 [Meiothermus sp.]|uniref:hypothetical protein n=1 Tax=Meiothermus sp. TaxID=1955249 RepID=UPI0026185687|nr:hypothetical protein [Meiothermus sp.]MCS7059357.1 hypothetical protein [Meiothermus sp.]